jgi:hypothetical protein
MCWMGMGTRGRIQILFSATIGVLTCMTTGTSFAEVRSFPIAASSEQAQSDETAAAATEPAVPVDPRGAIPLVAYTYSAFGVPGRSVGAAAYALSLSAAGQNAVVGGGGSVWWAPVERLTLIGDAQRNVYGNFSPSLGLVARLAGSRADGWSLSGIGKFKIDGFASGPDQDEIESEVEVGALVSFAQFGWFIDANAILGRGTGDDGEVDAEGRLRFGRDIGESLRLGFDGQVRDRLAGPRYLPNGRTWDFAAGAQAVVTVGNFFGSVTVGPATAGLLSSKIGLTALASVGAVTF